MKLSVLVAEIGGQLARGEPGRDILRLSTLEGAQDDTFCFVEGPGRLLALAQTRAGAVLIPPPLQNRALALEYVHQKGPALVVVPKPRLAFAKAARILKGPSSGDSGIDPRAFVHPEAQLGRRVRIDPFAYVGPRAVIGDAVRLQVGAQVHEAAEIGPESVLHPHAVVAAECSVGARCVLLPGSVVGSEGFGFVHDESCDEHLPMPQLGRAVLEDDVRLGAQSCVDRATLGETRIGRGTKIDNLVQIGHNVTVGPGCLLVAQAGVAGSSRIEAGAVVAAQAGVAGHLTVGAGAVIGGKAGVIRHVAPGRQMLGQPAVEKWRFLRESVLIGRLAELFRRVGRLEGQLDGAERADKGKQE